jgi:anti-anti-sigma factor
MAIDRPGNVLESSANVRSRVVARAVAQPSPGRLDPSQPGDGATCLYVRGHIDLAATPGLRDDFEQAILGAGSDVVLDCSDMTFMDGRAILQLAELRDSLAATGRRLRIAALSTEVARAIDLLGLTATLRSAEFLPTVEIPSAGRSVRLP